MSELLSDTELVGLFEAMIISAKEQQHDYLRKDEVRAWLETCLVNQHTLGNFPASINSAVDEAGKFTLTRARGYLADLQGLLRHVAATSASATVAESAQLWPEDGPKQIALADLSDNLSEMLDAYANMCNSGTVELNPELEQLLNQRGWRRGASGKWYTPDVAADLCPSPAKEMGFTVSPQTDPNGGGFGPPPTPPVGTGFAPKDDKGSKGDDKPKGLLDSIREGLEKGFDEALAGATPISRSTCGDAPIVNVAFSVAIQTIVP